jgi:hypothetical protein
MTDTQRVKVDDILIEVRTELDRALRLYRDMDSPHEGYAVILEELDELWEEIKKRDGQHEKMQKEAIQVAAMAVRFVLEVTRNIKNETAKN